MMTGNRPIWIGSARMLVLAAGFGVALALLAVPAFAQQPPAPKRDDYEQVLERYLQAARAVPATADNMWAAGLFSDLRARRVNDLVTVRVVENITASGSADSALDKKSNAAASVTKLFGTETKFPGWLDPTHGRGDRDHRRRAADQPSLRRSPRRRPPGADLRRRALGGD